MKRRGTGPCAVTGAEPAHTEVTSAGALAMKIARRANLNPGRRATRYRIVLPGSLTATVRRPEPRRSDAGPSRQDAFRRDLKHFLTSDLAVAGGVS